MKFQKAKEALAVSDASEVGKEMLTPITASAYVHGVVHETKRPIIELGTGYSVEPLIGNANGFFNRKIARLNTQHEALPTRKGTDRAVRDLRPWAEAAGPACALSKPDQLTTNFQLKLFRFNFLSVNLIAGF